MNAKVRPDKNSDTVQAYHHIGLKFPLLSREQEYKLAKAWQTDQDETALHTLIQSYMRLVLGVGAKFKNYGLAYGDLIQEGNLGLMQAAKRFDPDREVRFSTYATWWVKSYMQDYVLRNWSIVRTGTTSSHKKLFFGLRRMRALIHDFSSGPVSAQACQTIAEKLNVSEKDVAYMSSRLSVGDSSLNSLVFDDGEVEVQDTLCDPNPLPEDQAIQAIDGKRRRDWMERALSTLKDRERFIIERRHMTSEPLTLCAIGEQLAISKERVRQIEAQALKKLKAELSSAPIADLME
ncbi:RNA polymerase factor sigma-32 [Woodsholea maritima]|uniref:RNA polymerase factor sigma-32 n=1 Tax=Woodsholea maritima TaxID=240237 RepID=UPI00036B97E5|nr:RNA polymerase factor sigma-32 [Woodsholea maritima]